MGRPIGKLSSCKCLEMCIKNMATWLVARERGSDDIEMAFSSSRVTNSKILSWTNFFKSLAS